MSAVDHVTGRALDAVHHLGDVMSRVARQLQGEHGDVEATLQAITAAAVATGRCPARLAAETDPPGAEDRYSRTTQTSAGPRAVSCSCRGSNRS